MRNLDHPNLSISHKEAGQFEDTRFEKIHNKIFKSSEIGSKIVAKEIADLIKQKQLENKKCVLGLATGSSPIKVYEELIRMHKEEGLSFYNVVTFNLDEYYPMEKDNTESYHYFMQENLFKYIDINPKNIHIPDGMVLKEDLDEFCM